MKFFFAAGLLAVSLSSMLAEVPPRIPITDFFDNPKISSATISPDGQRFAFLAPEGKRLNIWVGDADEDFSKRRRLLSDKERGVFHFFWSRDGKYLIYEQDKGGDENFHLYRVDPSKPDEPAVDLTPEDGARAESHRSAVRQAR